MRLNIQYKITLMIAAIVAVILIGIYYNLNQFLQSQLSSIIHQQLNNEIKAVDLLLKTYALDTYSASDVDRVADDMAKAFQLRVTIMDQEGNVLGDSALSLEEVAAIDNHLYRPEVQQAISDGLGASRRFSNTVKKDMLYTAQKFTDKGFEGFIRLAKPIVEVDIMKARLQKFVGASLVTGFMLAIVIGLLVSSVVVQPIRDMSHIAQKIALGQFDHVFVGNRRDEIGGLAESINYMSDQIKTKISEVTSSRSRMEAVLLSMFEGVMVVDDQESIILMNKTLRDFLHVSEDPLGRKPLEIVRNIEIQEMIDKILKSRSSVESKELLIRVPDEKILMIHATPVAREGKTEGAVLVFHNITQLRRLENIRRDFVANVSHELRTPISTIKGYAETLLEGALDDKKHAKEFVRIIHSDAERLAQLINDLLDLSKIESGKMDLELRPQHIKPIIDRVIDALGSKIKEKSIKIDNKVSAALPKINLDERSVAQVFLNLIENAIKYNKPKGNVIITSQEFDTAVSIRVEDTGIGIPEEDLPRIFERFYRVDKAHSRQLGGTGLGLSIVKHIVQGHRGDVSVASEQEKGSIFTVTFPKA